MKVFGTVLLLLGKICLASAACDDVCLANYEPVCVNGKQYSNECKYDNAVCADAGLQGEVTEGQCKEDLYSCVTKEGWSEDKTDWCCANKKLGCPAPAACDDVCLANYKPVCVNGKQYSNECGYNNAVCADAGLKGEVTEGQCKAACDDVCLANYKPVCVNGKQYSNKCKYDSAVCADAALKGDVTEGQCKAACGDVCLANYEPVCVNGKQYSNECKYDNAVCADAALKGDVTEGQCKGAGLVFNCNTRERFTEEKKEWCCEEKKVGCAPKGKFACAKMDVWTEEEKDWCVKEKGVGESRECRDLPEWRDIGLYICRQYLSCRKDGGWEESVKENPKHYTEWANKDGLSARDACKKCGGGECMEKESFDALGFEMGEEEPVEEVAGFRDEETTTSKEEVSGAATPTLAAALLLLPLLPTLIAQ